MGRTVQELQASMTSKEFAQWRAFFDGEADGWKDEDQNEKALADYLTSMSI